MRWRKFFQFNRETPPNKKKEEEQDYYDTLGVEPTSTKKEIWTAFNRRASQTHPGKTKDPGKLEELLKIKQAHDVLFDPNERKKYDKERREDISHPHFSYKEADWSTKRKVDRVEKALKDLDKELIEELRDLSKNPDRHKDRIDNFEAYSNQRREEVIRRETEAGEDTTQRAA